MKLVPYLNFNGDCEEALNSYAEILNGKFEIVNRYDNPAMNAPEEYKDKILHARFYAGDIELYVSDVMPGRKTENNGNSLISLSLTVESREKGSEIFEKFSKIGKVRVPFKRQFWGGWHGNLVDRYGILWMVNFDESE